MTDNTFRSPNHNLTYPVPRRNHLAALGLLAIQAGLLIWGDTRQSPSIDEVGHLAAGLSHWELSRFDLYRVNPPLVRLQASLPVWLASPDIDWTKYKPSNKVRGEFSLGRELIHSGGPAALNYFVWARWACIPLCLLGGYCCFRWAGELYGEVAGLLSLTLWCFCPNILGNGMMITPDIGAASFGVFACYQFWRWLRTPTWSATFLSGLVLGCAELAKATWLVLFIVWPVLWCVCSGRRFSIARAKSEGGRLVLILLLAVFVINWGYGFEGTCEKLGSFSFISKSMGGARDGSPGNRFAGSSIGEIPLPLPRNYVLGIDVQKRDFERNMLSYLRGEWRHGGWWYYYLYALAIKVPIGTWLLVLFAAILSVAGMVAAPWRVSAPWRDEIVLLTPAVCVLVLVSAQTGFNHHSRYVLPILPFLFVWIGKAALFGVSRRWAAGFIVASLVWSVVSSLWIFPHSLSYFNEIVGGPRKGSEHLVDSNIDWGQDLLYLQRWLTEHPEAKSLGLAYFGGFDPRDCGMKFTLPPRGPVAPVDSMRPDVATLGPRPGWYAISVTLLRGYHYTVPTGDGGADYLDEHYYGYFLRFEPVAMAGYSIYIYHLSLADVNRVRRDLGLSELQRASDDQNN